MTLFCHPYFYKKFVTVIFTNVTVIFTIVTVLFTNVTVIFTNVTVFITKIDFDHLSPFLYTVFDEPRIGSIFRGRTIRSRWLVANFTKNRSFLG